MLKVQSEQLDHQRKLNAEQQADRRRAQAERVFIGAKHAPGQQVSLYAMNASDLPIFEVELWSTGSHGLPHGLSDPVHLGAILPGKQTSAHDLIFDTANKAMASIVLTFRDTTSRRWVRLPNGSLTKQPCNTTRDSVLAVLRDKGLAAQALEDTPGE
jgi:hypothetical protein